MLKPANFACQPLLRLTLLLLALLLSTLTVSAQTTTFTYQGKLADTGMPANGSYDFEFKLFDALTGGSGVGGALVNGVTVTNGIFTVSLDFGVCANCFNGANRFLEISVKPTSGSTYTLLSPRQQVTSAPYAIKSQNATTADGLSIVCVNCVTSSQIASVSGSAVTGTIPVSSVPPGSGNYIQNTVSQQAASDFNISGNGTSAGTLSGNVVNAVTQYNLGGARVLSNAGLVNLFVGVSAGATNTTGVGNSFFGFGAGSSNMTSSSNSFFGSSAGMSNTNSGNSFFGASAGQNNTMGGSNSFFGNLAGLANTTGGVNSFFGSFAGQDNTTGGANSFFGASAGENNTEGGSNSFFGQHAGRANTTGFSNSFFGSEAGLNNGTAAGNSFFGSNAGRSNTTGQPNSFFGTSAGTSNTTGNGNSFFGGSAGQNTTMADANSFFGASAGLTTTTGGSNVLFGFVAGLSNTTGKRNVMIGSNADFRSAQASSSGAVAGDENIFLGYQAGGAGARRNAAALGRNAFVACDDCMGWEPPASKSASG